MRAWLRTRMVHGCKVFVEPLEEGCLLLEPERGELDADKGPWLDERELAELRHERANYECAVRPRLRDARAGPRTRHQRVLFEKYRPEVHRRTTAETPTSVRRLTSRLVWTEIERGRHPHG